MKLNKMKKEELELLSYTDLTKMILEEENKSLSTPDAFKKICGLLELTDDDYVNKVGDYYTALTTDKRFVFLEDGTWDLKDKHKIEIILDEDEETETEELEEEEIEEEDPELDYNTLEEGVDEEDDDASEELEDLSIIGEDMDDEGEEEEEETI